MVVKRFRICGVFNPGDPGLAGDDQALAGNHHPVAILTPDRVDAAEARYGIAGVDFVDALPSLDQRAAIGNVAQDPAVDRRQPSDFDLGCGRRRRDRACRRLRSIWRV